MKTINFYCIETGTTHPNREAFEIHKAKLADEKDAAKKKRENQRLLKKGFNVLSMKFGR